MSKQSLHDLVEQFYRVCYIETKIPIAREITPKDMLAKDDDGNSEYVQWKLIERPEKIDSRFEDIEAELKVELPYSFKYWHSRYFQLWGDMGILRLPKTPSDNPYKPLRELLFETHLPEKYRKQGYVPFAHDGNDAGPLCFYTKADVENHDWPIYVWDHDAMLSSTWEDETSPPNDITLCFTNFRKLLECVVHLWGGELPDYPNLPKRYEGLKIIDPEGAGKYYTWQT